ncbi:MAG: hypothetical protein KIH08_01635 [Candidatus Freyarchaeota archaeon]|nr:hypothetical protein [Candidatus Jordarchaeia archaeon]MBS7268811.1 hypothetical protein [Candidatus Jordarchaeia archaeon]MBS7279152.1 hypothetical protein [Candidatus Jordarchaeia archaeon]
MREKVCDLFERLLESMDPIETWLRGGCIEFRDKEKVLAEIYREKAERKL